MTSSAWLAHQHCHSSDSVGNNRFLYNQVDYSFNKNILFEILTPLWFLFHWPLRSYCHFLCGEAKLTLTNHCFVQYMNITCVCSTTYTVDNFLNIDSTVAKYTIILHLSTLVFTKISQRPLCCRMKHLSSTPSPLLPIQQKEGFTPNWKIQHPIRVKFCFFFPFHSSNYYYCLYIVQ